MTLPSYVDEVKFKLTGGVLDLEIDDIGIQKIIEHSLRELQRYLGQSKFVTVPFSSCIDTSPYKISDVRMVYLADGGKGLNGATGADSTAGPLTDYAGVESIYANSPIDPMAWSMYYLGGNGTVSNYTNYVNNYYAYVETRKGINVGDLSRLSFNYNKAEEKLYINAYAKASAVTIEYVPRFDNVEDITNDAWIDILVRYSVANLKVTLGRVRSRFTQSNALWSQDGETLLTEGNQELADLRNYLEASASILRPR